VMSWRLFVVREIPRPGAPGAGGAPGLMGSVILEADPAEATIELAGQPVATGTLRTTLAAGRDHALRLTAPGCAETTLTLRLTPGATGHRTVALRRLLADLRIETSPAGARIRVDGSPLGTSPLTVRGLALERPHEVEAVLSGHATVRQSTRLREAGKVSTITLALDASKAELMVTSDPPGAAISMDGVPRGTAPSRLPGIAFGRHQFSARAEGYTPMDSTLEVSGTSGQIHFAFMAEPPGVLIVQGDKPANIYVDGRLVAENLQNSGPQKLPRGTHEIKVVLASGEPVSKSLVVNPRERVVYDFTKGSISRTP
jgi:hypothetical protein